MGSSWGCDTEKEVFLSGCRGAVGEGVSSPLCNTLCDSPQTAEGRHPSSPAVTYNNRLPWNSNLVALSGE